MGQATSSVGALRFITAFAVLAFAAPAAAQVVVVLRAPVDRDVARQLRQLLDVPVEERAAPEGSARLGDILQHASESWSAEYAVVIDRPNGAAQVLRLQDRTAASRILTSDVMSESYAVALAIAELLEWLGAVQPARAVASGSPAANSARPAEVDGVGVGTEDAFALTAVVGADFEITSSPGYDVSLWRPALGAGLQWGRGRSSPWFGVGARVAAPASTELQLDRTTPGQIASIRYTSVDPAVNGSVGFGTANASLVGELALGLSILEVEGRSATGARLAENNALSPWIGLGLFLRYPLVWGLSLSVGAEGQWLVERARYRVDGASVLEEGRVRLATRLGVRWESGP